MKLLAVRSWPADPADPETRQELDWALSRGLPAAIEDVRWEETVFGIEDVDGRPAHIVTTTKLIVTNCY